MSGPPAIPMRDYSQNSGSPNKNEADELRTTLLQSTLNNAHSNNNNNNNARSGGLAQIGVFLKILQILFYIFLVIFLVVFFNANDCQEKSENTSVTSFFHGGFSSVLCNILSAVLAIFEKFEGRFEKYTLQAMIGCFIWVLVILFRLIFWRRYVAVLRESKATKEREISFRNALGAMTAVATGPILGQQQQQQVSIQPIIEEPKNNNHIYDLPN